VLLLNGAFNNSRTSSTSSLHLDHQQQQLRCLSELVQTLAIDSRSGIGGGEGEGLG
jgi:hypothetical protein